MPNNNNKKHYVIWHSSMFYIVSTLYIDEAVIISNIILKYSHAFNSSPGRYAFININDTHFKIKTFLETSSLDFYKQDIRD